MSWNDNRDDNVVPISDAKKAQKSKPPLIAKGHELEEERRERSVHLAMEKQRRVLELRFYYDLQGILEVVRELADLAEGNGAPESEVDDLVDEIVRRIDRLPPPREAKLRLELGRAGEVVGGVAANDRD